MEKELIDFDEWIKHQQSIEVKYWAVFNDDGAVTGIYPDKILINNENKILIDTDIAEKIQEGVILLHHCYVDVLKKKFFITEEVKKQDNVLHRVPDRRWENKEYFDFYIEYYSSEQRVNIALTERFSGTRKSNESAEKSKVFNDRQVEVLLYFTDYNDPNILFYSIRVSLGDLYESEKSFNNIELPNKFSVYTRRYFDDYVLEIK